MVGVKPGSPATTLVPNALAVKKTGDGFVFSLLQPGKNTGVLSLTIFNVNGATMAHFSAVKSNYIVWNTMDRTISEGLFIVKVDLPDRSTISRAVVFTK
jgi:hypothetical protein